MEQDQATARERKQQVTEALTGVLEDGEAFVVARTDDQVIAVPVQGPAANGAPALATSDPDLYGRLIGLNAKLHSPAGGFLGNGLIVAALAFCVALVAGVDLPLLPSTPAENLQSGWAYAGIIAIAVFVSFALKALLRRLAWLGGQGEVARVLRACGVTRGELLAQLRGDDKLELVKTFLGRAGGDDKG